MKLVQSIHKHVSSKLFCEMPSMHSPILPSLQFPEMQGSVFQEGIPMPDPPSKGFLRGAYQGLFGGGGPKPCDREELFGEAAGKIGSNVAKHIPGKNMAMEQLQGGRRVIQYLKFSIGFWS